MKRILILASNPRKDLNLDREIRDLKEVIEKSRSREQFEVVAELAVRVGDLQDLMLKHEPQIVHFCGHGGGEKGLVFVSDEAREQLLQTGALSDLFRLCAKHVECVLLNACYSEVQANAMVAHVNYVIGMNQEIQDNAAIAFAKGFYRALGYDRPTLTQERRTEIQLEVAQSLAKDSASDQYRAKAREFLADRKLSDLEKIRLGRLRKDLGLSEADVNQIVAEELEPILKAQDEYEEMLIGLIEAGRYPFGPEINNELQIHIQDLGLTGEGFETIAQPILKAAEADYQQRLAQERHRQQVAEQQQRQREEIEQQQQEAEHRRQEQAKRQPLLKPFEFQIATVNISTRVIEKPGWLGKKTETETTVNITRQPGQAEAFWEYTCRAGTTTPFHFGETITTDLANYRGTDWEYQGTAYPGKYGKGPYGSYREQTTDSDYGFLENGSILTPMSW